MTRVDDLWLLADEASQCAEQAYHGLRERYPDFAEPTKTRTVGRARFRTLARRVERTGAPYGAHTIVYRTDVDECLLVRHDGVGLWVLPGGEVGTDETFADAARRELDEEAGVEATYEGLAMATRVTIRCDAYETWGVIPVFAAEAETTATRVADPDDEISEARWFDFDALPRDTRDRDHLLAWRDRRRG